MNAVTMLRSPSLPLHDYDDASSPDPLATSINEETRDPAATVPSSPIKLRQPLSARSDNNSKYIPKSRLIPTNNNKLSSPSKTITEQTLSPWKIRVTVEAEPENMSDLAQLTTRTTRIPLRQPLSPTIQSRNGRERQPRGISAKPKRSSTPTRGRSRSQTRRKSVTDLDIVVLGDDAESDDWTKQRSPRKCKKSVTKKEKKSDKPPEESPADSGSAVEHSEAQEDADIYVYSNTSGQQTVEQGLEIESPALRSIDLNRVSVRSRTQNSKKRETDPEQGEEVEMQNQKAAVSTSSIRKVSNNSAMSYPTPSPTSSYHGSEMHEKDADPTNQYEGFDTILESEGFTMIELDSIPSVKRLMSSPENVPSEPADGDTSSKQTSSTRHDEMAAMQNKPSAWTQAFKASAIPSYMRFVDGDSDISSNLEMPSSPPASTTSKKMLEVPKQRTDIDVRKETPEPYSSPRLPSPPRQAQKSSEDETSNKILPRRVVSAGKSLQSVISVSSVISQNAITRDRRTPSANHANLFDGFDSGTKRELRAGLRFGEELAKRATTHLSSKPMESVQPSASRSDLVGESRPNNQQHKTQTQIWRGETTVQHTPVAILSDKKFNQNGEADFHGNLGQHSSQASSITDSISGTRCSTQTPQTSSSLNPDLALLNAQAQTKKQWQLERETVSQQIENAPPGKVIVIDSDSDEENEAHIKSRNCHESIDDAGSGAGDADEDIWLAEAQNSSSSPRADEIQDHSTSKEQRRQRERAAEAVNRPRRSLIPSPWKRGEDVENASTFLTNGDMSGIFWQQQQPQDRVKFGAADIARQRKTLSGKFDVDRMARSPIKSTENPEHDSSFRFEADLTQDAPVDGKQFPFDQTHVEENDSYAEDVSATENVEGKAESSQQLQDSIFSQASSSPVPVKIPVNFNDSTISNIQNQPPERSALSNEDIELRRPSTPRSAMKGTRQTFGLEKPDTPPRRVVFNDRSMYLNEDGIESTMSANFDSPQPDPAYVQSAEEKIITETETAGQSESVESDVETEVVEKKKSGWLGWLWKGRDDQSTAQHDPVVNTTTQSQTNGNITKYDGTTESETSEWQPTKSSIPSSHPHESSHKPLTRSQRRSNHESKSTTKKVPSYLLPPSYPSDPTRPRMSTNNLPLPLATSGEFTNAHFRTLHIIHAKSERPRFHAPKTSEIRPTLKNLLGWKLEVDESDAGLGVFGWTVGSKEVEVLERFMLEVEFGWIQHKQAEKEQNGGDEKELDDVIEIEWGWSVEEIATYLGRIVVGEVVRKEEGKSK